jgi:hypothetical protein
MIRCVLSARGSTVIAPVIGFVVSMGRLKVTPACDLREKAPLSAKGTAAGVTETAFEAGPVAVALDAVTVQV